MEINLFKYLTIRRAVNIFQITASYQLSKLLHRPIVWGMPISYSIEPTNRCNFKCPECPSGLGKLTRQLGSMKIEKFQEILDQISATGFYLQLYFQGEPYINKEIKQFIAYAKKKNVYTSISTNGSYINKINVDDLLLNAPDKLIYSIDGLDDESYSIYRVGGTFKKADENLRLLFERRTALGLKSPYIEIQFIVMKHNEHQIEKLFSYGKELGADKVTLKTMQVSSVENAEKFLPKNEDYRRYIVDENGLKIKGKQGNYCFALWRTSVITWDGKVVPCCFDKDAENVFGEVDKNKRMSKIWKNDHIQKFRQSVLDSRKNIQMCTNCTEGLKTNIMEIES